MANLMAESDGRVGGGEVTLMFAVTTQYHVHVASKHLQPYYIECSIKAISGGGGVGGGGKYTLVYMQVTPPDLTTGSQTLYYCNERLIAQRSSILRSTESSGYPSPQGGWPILFSVPGTPPPRAIECHTQLFDEELYSSYLRS